MQRALRLTSGLLTWQPWDSSLNCRLLAEVFLPGMEDKLRLLWPWNELRPGQSCETNSSELFLNNYWCIRWCCAHHDRVHVSSVPQHRKRRHDTGRLELKSHSLSRGHKWSNAERVEIICKELARLWCSLKWGLARAGGTVTGQLRAVRTAEKWSSQWRRTLRQRRPDEFRALWEKVLKGVLFFSFPTELGNRWRWQAPAGSVTHQMNGCTVKDWIANWNN